jgi:hypothetical protein
MNADVCALRTEAGAAYECGLYREAADRYERACRIAQAEACNDLAFVIATDAAGIWHLAGQPLRGLSLVLEVLANIPANIAPHDIWMAKLRAFELMRCFRPDLPFLEACLSDLRVLAREHDMEVTADLLRLEALLCRARGQHAEALARFEQAWNHAGTCGLHPYLIVYGAIFSALGSMNLTAAHRWSELLSRMGEASLEVRAAWYESQARVGLYRNEPDLARAMVRDLEHLVAKTQQAIWQRRVVMLRVRSWLLSTTPEDPMSLSHPLWTVLTQHIDGTSEVFDEYDRVLTLVDVRVAALRFALKVQPVDDLFYSQPQRFMASKRADFVPSDEVARRVEQFHWALKRAVPLATRLDAAFRCNWRKAELLEREARVEELVEWYRGINRR